MGYELGNAFQSGNLSKYVPLSSSASTVSPSFLSRLTPVCGLLLQLPVFELNLNLGPRRHASILSAQSTLSNYITVIIPPSLPPFFSSRLQSLTLSHHNDKKLLILQPLVQATKSSKLSSLCRLFLDRFKIGKEGWNLLDKALKKDVCDKIVSIKGGERMRGEKREGK